MKSCHFTYSHVRQDVLFLSIQPCLVKKESQIHSSTGGAARERRESQCKFSGSGWSPFLLRWSGGHHTEDEGATLPGGRLESIGTVTDPLLASIHSSDLR